LSLDPSSGTRSERLLVARAATKTVGLRTMPLGRLPLASCSPKEEEEEEEDNEESQSSSGVPNTGGSTSGVAPSVSGISSSNADIDVAAGGDTRNRLPEGSTLWCFPGDPSRVFVRFEESAMRTLLSTGTELASSSNSASSVPKTTSGGNDALMTSSNGVTGGISSAWAMLSLDTILEHANLPPPLAALVNEHVKVVQPESIKGVAAITATEPETSTLATAASDPALPASSAHSAAGMEVDSETAPLPISSGIIDGSDNDRNSDNNINSGSTSVSLSTSSTSKSSNSNSGSENLWPAHPLAGLGAAPGLLRPCIAVASPLFETEAGDVAEAEAPLSSNDSSGFRQRKRQRSGLPVAVTLLRAGINEEVYLTLFISVISHRFVSNFCFAEAIRIMFESLLTPICARLLGPFTTGHVAAIASDNFP